MKCPHTKTSVIDSRDASLHERKNKKIKGLKAITVRRHKCMRCGERFTTYECTIDQLDEYAAKTDNDLRKLMIMLNAMLLKQLDKKSIRGNLKTIVDGIV